ncbi:hypothetical protein HYH02_003964 [Chlamydomonas schloesseri]|uniref:Uncharacterized protein n=1 Tax=Chlamydomonas schloesseri TaxID=2026947 RepID=A0A835WPM6_9CHLO|nr:hypothetical protein HYH02_003964 [Chlamydomonas schloesseri]|eukprot:KAG2451360.1 hypothetical protein HYH02_003964 [Chlamydomonas schloesseri]
MVDAETLALSVPLVCMALNAATREESVWQAHLPSRALAQLAALQALGPRPLQPGHLYLALCGRNLLRNPEFRRDCNSPTLWGAGPERTAWVINQHVGKEVSWERTPQGMTPPPSPPAASAPAAATSAASTTQPRPHAAPAQRCSHQQLTPPPPLPYPSCQRSPGLGGGKGPGSAVAAGSKLAFLMRRALRGLGELAAEGVAAVEEGLRLRDQPSVREASEPEATESGGDEAHSHASAGPGMAGEPGTTAPAERPCLAMLGSWSEVVQVVDLQWELQRRGLSAAQAAHLLDAGLGLRLAVHVGSRWDSPGECAMALRLDEGPGAGPGGAGSSGSGSDAAPSLQAYVARPTRALVYLEREHMRCGVWEEVEHVVPACPRGFRRAVVLLRGRRAPVSAPVPAPMPAEPPRRQEGAWVGGGGGGDGGDSDAAGAGAVAEAGPADPDVEPPTRFCGAKFASAQLVFC